MLTFDIINLQNCSFKNRAEKNFKCPKFFEEIRTFIRNFAAKILNPGVNCIDGGSYALTILMPLTSTQSPTIADPVGDWSTRV